MQKKVTQGSAKFSVQIVKITFILLKCHISIYNSNDFYLFIVVKKLMITKNSVVKIQNLAVNHKSRPAKSNPAVLENISYEGLRKMVKVEISPNNQ